MCSSHGGAIKVHILAGHVPANFHMQILQIHNTKLLMKAWTLYSNVYVAQVGFCGTQKVCKMSPGTESLLLPTDKGDGKMLEVALW